jgi:DNA invertase Pin-like site-specific DNA recombinase
MRVAYIRTSTTEQSPELQLNDISTMVCLSDCIHLKEQESAYKTENVRVELEKLKNLICRGVVSDVYVWALDRLYRNRKRLLEFLTLCKIHSVKVHSYKQKWLESINNIPEPFNEIVYDMMIQILGFIAEEESAVKSARIKNALRKTEVGKSISYKGNKWGRKSFTKNTIRKVLDLRNQGKTIRDIASLVFVYDSNNNSKLISKSAVHKILGDITAKKGSNLGCP